MALNTERSSGEGVIAGASWAIKIGTVFLRAAQALGKALSPAIVRVGAHAGNAASIVAAADEIHREQGLTHKAERAGAGLASTGVNLALGGAAATAGETAALTGVAGTAGATVMTAAAPVVLSLAAASVTAKVADLAIENRRQYEDLDRDRARCAAPAKLRSRPPGEKPSLLDYKHGGAVLAVSAQMRDSALHGNGKIERFADSHRIRNFAMLDMTDTVNLAEYERALHEEIDEQRAAMARNDSILPRWLRHGDSVNRYNFAAGELADLRGAQQELAMFKEDMLRRSDRHAGGLSSGLAAPKDPRLAPVFNAAVAGVSDRPASAKGAEQPGRLRSLRPITPV